MMTLVSQRTAAFEASCGAAFGAGGQEVASSSAGGGITKVAAAIGSRIMTNNSCRRWPPVVTMEERRQRCPGSVYEPREMTRHGRRRRRQPWGRGGCHDGGMMLGDRRRPER
jgi:hypothetical protein